MATLVREKTTRSNRMRTRTLYRTQEQLLSIGNLSVSGKLIIMRMC